jgi:Fe2+ or Zn2+ uptake regulation protein
MLYESLHEWYPAISLSTVYATLEVFLKKGLVRRVSPQSGRIRVDGTAPDHDHATCRLCGEVYDIGRDLIDRPAVPDRLPAGLRVTNLYIEYEVVCPTCQSES